MSRYLTEHGFANTPPLLGEVVRVDADGTPHTLGRRAGLRRATRATPGPGRSISLERAVDELARREADAERGRRRSTDYHALRRARIGRRLGELHAALARRRDDPAFAPRAGRRERRRRAGPSARIGAARRGASTPSPARTDWRRARPTTPIAERCSTRREALIEALRSGWPKRRRRADDPHPWRLPSRARCWSRRAMPTSSTSRASRRGRSTSAAPRPARCATSPACCARFDYAAATTLDPQERAASRASPRHARRALVDASARRRAARPSSTAYRDGVAAHTGRHGERRRCSTSS